MTVRIGDTIPKSSFTVMTAEGPQVRSSDELFNGQKVVLFGVAGAFTPLCDRNHLPGFLANIDAFKERGIDAVAVTSVNDVFVMEAWAKGTGAAGKITCLADGNGDFARAWAYVRFDLSRARHPLAALCNDYR